jgi:alkaline phosphatase D
MGTFSKFHPAGSAVALMVILCFAPHCTSLRSPKLGPSGNAALQSGPMLGYVDMLEALIWVQTKGPARVEIEYWDQEKPEQKYRVEPRQTSAAQAFTAKCVANAVQPGRSYAYNLYLNGGLVKLPYPATFKTQPLWQWRTDPPAFSVALGSCAYVNEPEYDRPGKPYGSNFQIFGHIVAQKPDLMLWLGDNHYYREVDWNTWTGMQHRATHTRSLPELQPLLAATHHYAIWDDHDFGPNDSDGTFLHKDMAWEVFRDFWGNPSFGVNGQKGCTSYFKYADMDFFLLDNRYFRTPDHCASCPERSQLGKAQREWFLAALAESTAPFKLVAIGGQVLSDNPQHETYTHYFKAERDSILRFIERENIQNVVFLSGDLHYSELSALQNAAGNWVYDLTTSPLTSGAFSGAAEKEYNTLRVPGSLVDRHNFAVLRFSGARTKRSMEISQYDANGKQLWTKTIESVRR